MDLMKYLSWPAFYILFKGYQSEFSLRKKIKQGTENVFNFEAQRPIEVTLVFSLDWITVHLVFKKFLSKTVEIKP